jgi:hypothetical protein
MVEARAARSAFARRAAGMADAPLGPTIRARCWWPLDLHPLLYPSSSCSSNTLTARTQVDHFCAGGPQDIPIRAECPPLTPFTNTTQGDGPGACVGCEAGTSFYNGTCVVECAVGYYANSTMATSCEACEVSVFGLHRPRTHVFNACPTMALPPIHAIPSVSFPFHRSTQHFFPCHRSTQHAPFCLLSPLPHFSFPLVIRSASSVPVACRPRRPTAPSVQLGSPPCNPRRAPSPAVSQTANPAFTASTGPSLALRAGLGTGVRADPNLPASGKRARSTPSP